jgi:hypothetical protein
MSHLVTVFEDKESSMDLMINNRTYSCFQSIFLEQLSESECELREMFESTHAFNGINLEIELRNNPLLLKRYVSLWRSVIHRLRKDHDFRSRLFEENESLDLWLAEISGKVEGWHSALRLV